MRPTLKIFTLIRRQLSLLYKSSLIISLMGSAIKIEKQQSDFYMVSTSTSKIGIRSVLLKRIGQSLNQNDSTRITNVTFGRSFIISIVIVDILKTVKQARLENLYDFFNFPVKFNALLDLSYKDFIILSMYSKKNEKTSK